MVVGVRLRHVLDGVDGQRHGLAVDGDKYHLLVHVHVQLIGLNSPRIH